MDQARNRQPQSLDETNEIYPTCFNRFFADNKEVLSRQDPDSMLPNSETVFKLAFRNATGRTLESRTIIPRRRGGHGGGDGSILEDVVFSYDALGHRTTMTRYQDPTNQAGPVTTTWHTDSLDWLTRLEEPGVAPQTRIFDSWGEVTQVQWCNDLGTASCPAGQDRVSLIQYDAMGRVTHREDKAGGQTVPETVSDFSYDANSSAIEGVPRNNVLGRLALATWSTGQEWFTYDDSGRVNSRTFVDTTVTPNPPHHYEIHEFHRRWVGKDPASGNTGYQQGGRAGQLRLRLGRPHQIGRLQLCPRPLPNPVLGLRRRPDLRCVRPPP